MDSCLQRNGRLIDLVDNAWRSDELALEDIKVPVEELPDPEADSADSHLTLKEQAQRWQDNLPDLSMEQINIHDQLPKYLSEIRFLTTKCIIIETEKVAKKTHGALIVVKQFRVQECGHKEPVTGAHCILSMVGKKNDNHYIVASQDRDLQEKLRKIAGVPLLYLHNKAPSLEKPTPISYNKAQTKQDNLFNMSGELKVLEELKMKTGLETKVREITPKIKKKKMKGPNPLSCKKKKTSSDKLRKKSIAETSKKIRKRRKAKFNTLC